MEGRVYVLTEVDSAGRLQSILSHHRTKDGARQFAARIAKAAGFDGALSWTKLQADGVLEVAPYLTGFYLQLRLATILP